MSSLPNRPLQGPRSIGIIGAGAVGLSSALHLQRAGHAVEIFDPRPPGEGASLGNAGIIASSEVLPLGRPSTLHQLPRMLFDPTGPLVIRWRYLPRIAPWLCRFVMACRSGEVNRISAALASLVAPAAEDWRDIVAGSGAEGRLRANGWLRVYPTARDFERALPDIVRQRALGVKLDLLSADEIRQLEPALAPVFAGATFCADAWNVDSPLRMMQVLAALVGQRGGIFQRREVRRVDEAEGRPVIVAADGSSFPYDNVIIAAGAWSRSIVRTLGIDVPLDTERGYHVMLAAPAKSLRRPVSVTKPGYSLVQMEDGLRLTSGVEFAGLDAAPDFRRVRRMAAHAATVLPGLDTRPTSEWLGFRPSMPRSLPVIGPLRARPGVILAFGHGHLGLSLGPITGRLVAAVVDGRAPPIDMAPFLPRQ